MIVLLFRDFDIHLVFRLKIKPSRRFFGYIRVHIIGSKLVLQIRIFEEAKVVVIAHLIFSLCRFNRRKVRSYTEMLLTNIRIE